MLQVLKKEKIKPRKKIFEKNNTKSSFAVNRISYNYNGITNKLKLEKDSDFQRYNLFKIQILDNGSNIYITNYQEGFMKTRDVIDIDKIISGRKFY